MQRERKPREKAMKHVYSFLAGALMASVVPTALANPIQVYTDPDPQQDDWMLDGLVDELGVGFPLDERISAQEVPWEGHVPCPADYQYETSLGKSVQIEITNLSGREWTELYYVADELTFLSNVDEMVGDMSLLGSKEAFKIDAVGLNTPLVYESMNADGKFEVNETWQFVIQEYFAFDGTGYAPYVAPAALASPGVAMASGWFAAGETTLSTGSIVAIPEPGTVALLGIFGLGLFIRKRLMI